MDANIKTGYLKDEYFKLQEFYEDYDKRLLGIKGWSVTVGVVALGAGFQNKMPNLWLFASIASILFFILELYWKTFQHCYYPRIKKLETAFRDDNFKDIQPLQIHFSWQEALAIHKKNRSVIFRVTSIYFPHLLSFLAGIVLFFVHKLNFIVFETTSK